MKKLILFTFILLIISTNTFAQNRQYVLSGIDTNLPSSSKLTALQLRNGLKDIVNGVYNNLDVRGDTSLYYNKTKIDYKLANLNIVTTTEQLTDWATATASFVTGTPWTSLGYWTASNHPTTTSDYGLPAYPTTLPASDVYSWAKATTKPTYTASEVGLGNVNNTSDANKPVSTAQQTALNLKANVADTITATDIFYTKPQVRTITKLGTDSIWFNTTNHKIYANHSGYTYRYSPTDSVLMTNWTGLRTSAVLGLELDESSGTSFTGSFLSHNGTGSGTITSGATGKLGKSVTFTAGDIQVPNTTDFNATTLSINVWVYPSLTGLSTLISRTISGTDSQFGIQMYSSGELVISSNGFTPTAVTTASYMTLNTWQMLTITLDGTSLKIYRNATLLNTYSMVGSPNTSTNPLHVGVLGFGGFDPWIGGIDQVVFWKNRVITQSDVDLLYNSGNGRLISLW